MEFGVVGERRVQAASAMVIWHASSNNDDVALSLSPSRLRRYTDVARVLYTSGRSDLVRKAGLEEALEGEPLLPTDDRQDPRELATDLEKLGPAFIKLGQLLSTRADLLPPPYLDALARLQDRSSRSPSPRSRASSRRTRRADLEGVCRFDAEPMAAASLGQVHRAHAARRAGGRGQGAATEHPRGHGGGPGDHGGDRRFPRQPYVGGAAVRVRQMVAEFRRALHRNSITSARRATSSRSPTISRLSPRMVVPRPVEDYTSSRVLTMELVKGQRSRRSRR